MSHFKNAEGKPIVLALIKAIQSNKDYLGEIDGLIGDGDHGMNMNKGFSMCETRISGRDISFSDALSELGDVLLTEIGGSMGPIYGTIFYEMSDASGENIDARVFGGMLNAGLEGLRGITDAKAGDKTLMDVLEPAVSTFNKAVDGGKSFTEALNDLKGASEAGKEASKELVAKFGRSSRLGERSKGVYDAGAVSCNIILQAMADQILAML